MPIANEEPPKLPKNRKYYFGYYDWCGRACVMKWMEDDGIVVGGVPTPILQKHEISHDDYDNTPLEWKDIGMGNRNMQQKLLKLKRRGRFAKFSGATAKHAVRIERRVVMIGEDKTEIKEFLIPVGKISLSKQVISTGRGPDSERMAEYYSRVSADSFLVPLTEKNYVLEQYEHILRDTPRQNKLRLEFDEMAGFVDLFWVGAVYFFVEVDYIQRKIRRSRDYSGRDVAFNRYRNKRISWLSVLPLDPSMLPR